MGCCSNNIRDKGREPQALHCATPDFLSGLVAMASFMRLSSRKAARVVIVGVAQ